MRVELTTRVELDGAEFTFGTADAELLRASEAVNTALPIILPEALGLGWDEIAKLSEDEMAEKLESIGGLESRYLPAAVQETFCALFVAAIRTWRGVEDAAGDRLDCDAETTRDFPTSQKVEIVCEYFNERKRLEGKGTRPSESASS